MSPKPRLLATLAAVGLAGAFALWSTPPAAAQATEAPVEYHPDHLRAARAFIEATGGDDLGEQMLVAFRPHVGQVIHQHHPDITDGQFKRFMELFTAAFREQKPVFRQISERIFAGFISKDDLEAGADFYESAAGRSFIAARPKIAEAMTRAGKQAAAAMTMDDIAPHLTDDENKAYRDFVDSDLGHRLAEAQKGIHIVWARFGARIGRQVSGEAGAKALKQMEAEGNGL